MSVGALRHRFTLEAPIDSDDGAGGFTRHWSPVAALWGALRPLSARERVAGGGLEMAVSHIARIRHRTTIDGTMRLALGGRCFAIHAITDPDERGQWLDLMLEEIRL